MPTQEQAKAIERYSTEVWGQGNVEVVDDIFASDYVRHGPDLEGASFDGTKSLKELVALYRTALPDLKVPIEAMVGEGDMVVTRWGASGTNDGPMLGVPPTGKPCQVFGFWMHRFEGDKIAEEWVTWDTHGFLQQIGVSLP
jgi:steroid delta-isomerase-like uncharacterized protein